MPGESVETFLKRELGVESLKLLNKFVATYDLIDIEHATLDLKQKFMAEIQPEFNQKSQGRARFLSAELMSILGIKQKSTNNDEAEKIKQKAIKKFLDENAEDRLLKSFSKVEAIYNLFWSKAADSVERGVDEETIRKRCNDILAWLKSDLFSVCEELESNLGIEFNNAKSHTDSKFKFINSEFSITRQKSPYQHMFEEFREQIETSYAEFYNLFMDSMNKDIELGKKKESDAELIAETRKKTDVVWKKIISSFESLKDTFNKTVSEETMEDV